MKSGSEKGDRAAPVHELSDQTDRSSTGRKLPAPLCLHIEGTQTEHFLLVQNSFGDTLGIAMNKC